MNQLFSRLLVIACTLLFFGACTNRSIGYAVVLWPQPDSGLQEGTVLNLVAASEAANTVTLRLPDGQETVSGWRVIRFDDRDQAETFRERFAPWQDRYARSLRTALPVRERADRMSTRVYRLRDGEVVKIISRLDEQSDEAGLVDYWYEVLTGEGITGWVFGYHLQITGASGRPVEAGDDLDETDRLVADIASVAWRPAYFEAMITNGRIQFDRFGPRFGLFGDVENGRFSVILPGLERTFEYDGYFSPVRNTIEFEGTSLTLALVGERRVEAQYNVNGRVRSTTFVQIDEDLGEVIDAERERRRQLLDQILSRGNGLISTAYGTVQLGERGTISWTGYERLVPSVLPTTFDGTASLEFSLHLADELRGRYDGGLRMVLGNNETVAFLYNLLDDGLRLVYVPDTLIDDEHLVEEEPISAVVMFYRFISS